MGLRSCVFNGWAVSLGSPWSQCLWVYFLRLVKFPGEGSSDLPKFWELHGGKRLECPKFRTLDSCVLLFQQPHLSFVCVPLRGRRRIHTPVCPLQTVNLQCPAMVGEGLRGSNCFCNSGSTTSVCSLTSTSRGTCNWQLLSLLEILKYKIRCFSNFSLPAYD